MGRLAEVGTFEDPRLVAIEQGQHISVVSKTVSTTLWAFAPPARGLQEAKTPDARASLHTRFLNSGDASVPRQARHKVIVC